MDHQNPSRGWCLDNPLTTATPSPGGFVSLPTVSHSWKALLLIPLVIVKVWSFCFNLDLKITPPRWSWELKLHLDVGFTFEAGLLRFVTDGYRLCSHSPPFFCKNIKRRQVVCFGEQILSTMKKSNHSWPLRSMCKTSVIRSKIRLKQNWAHRP